MTVRVLVGDARAALKTLPDESVDCCVTSPPYFGLRSYGGGEQEIGRESTVQGFVLNLVDVFAEVRRVLKPHGTCFVNIGDCYAGSQKGRMADGSVVGGAKQRTNKGTMENTRKRGDRGGVTSKQASNSASLAAGDATCPPGLKPKDLMLVPARLAIALQDDGWWVRSEIVWAKPNPMPESVKSRPSTAHEHIWFLAKSGKHFYDDAAAQVPVSEATVARGVAAVKALERGIGDVPCKWEDSKEDIRKGGAPIARAMARYAPRDWRFGKGGNGRNDEKRQYASGNALHRNHDSNTGFSKRWEGKLRRSFDGKWADGQGMNKYERARDLKHEWTGPDAPATRRLRNYEPAPLEVWRFSPAQYREAHFATFPPTLVERCLATGCPEGGVVLDPFGGAGTTGLVADYLGYDAVLCELNPEYADLAVERIRKEAPLTADVEAVPVQEELL